MPVLLLLVGVATLAFVASNSYAKKPGARTPYQLDSTLDRARRAQVEAALAHENNPGLLEAFAGALANAFPNAAWYLRTKAAALRHMGYGASPALPQSATQSYPGVTGYPGYGSPAYPGYGGSPGAYSPGPSTSDGGSSQAVPVGAQSGARSDGLDANLPDDVRFNVVELLTNATDPAMVDAFAAKLGVYPMAQAVLRLRAAFLRSQAPQTSIPVSVPNAPPPAASAAPSLPPIPGLDPGMSADLALQIAQVLMTENDPAKLRALGNSLLPQFPTAAAMLLGKANAIAPPIAGPVPPPVPVVAPPPPAVPPSPSIPDAPPAPVLVLPSPVPVLAPPPAIAGLFDAGMSPEDQSRVLSALTSETDPTKLRQLADSIASKYPKAALLLTNKAEALSALLFTSQSPAPVIVHVPPPAAPPPGSPPIVQVMTTESTYKVLAGDFPIKIAKKYGQPESAWHELVAANPTKARAADGNFKTLLPGETLFIPASWVGHRDGSIAANHAGDAAASPVGLVVSTPPAGATLDPGLPGDVAQAVMTALATETDPAALRGFASSLMATFPVAAGVLLAKANAVGLAAPAATALLHLPSGAPPAAPAAVPVVHAAPAATSPGTPIHASPGTSGHTYRVVAGDSPSRIAKRLTGNDGRWRELVAANPQKAKQPNGNFKSLLPGEVLQLPASWSSPPQGAPTIAARA